MLHGSEPIALNFQRHPARPVVVEESRRYWTRKLVKTATEDGQSDREVSVTFAEVRTKTFAPRSRRSIELHICAIK